MKLYLVPLAASLAMLTGGCATDGYYGTSVGYGAPYAYNGWYDGYYGNIYDGYWGRDNYFYYRSSDRDNRFRRGDRAHFRQGDRPGDGFRPMQGNFQPRAGMHTPHYPGRGRR